MKIEKTAERFLPPLWVLTLLAAALLLWVTYQLKEIIVLLVVGYAVSYLIDPLLDYFEKKRISRSVGIFVLLGTLLIAIFLIVTTVLPVLANEYQRLSDNFPSYLSLSKDKIHSVIGSLKEKLPKDLHSKLDLLESKEIMPSVTGDTLENIFAGLGTALLKGYSVTLTLLNLLLLPFIVYYLSVDFDKNHNFILQLIPKKYRYRTKEIALEIDTYVSGFVRGQLLVGIILFTLYTLGLGVLGVELWFLLAVISGFGNLIPYLGTCVGIVLSSIMALVTFQDLGHIYWVWAIYAAVQFLEGTFITPYIVGKNVGISPLGIILAIFAGSKLFGILGLLLAVPMAAVLKVLFKRLHEWVVVKV